MAPVQEGQEERALLIGQNEGQALNAACDLPEPKLIQREGTYPVAHYGAWANKNILVYGISVESGLDFSAQLNGDQTNKVLDMVADYIEQMPDVNKREPFSKSIGSPCLALFSGDGLWYRARIVKDLGEDVYEVKFVDYGDVERVKSENMIKCSPELCAYPEGVTEIAIYGFTGDEPAEEIEALRSLVEQKDLIGVIDSVEFEIKGKTRLLLSLYNLNWEPIRACVKRSSGIPLSGKSTDTESPKPQQCEIKDVVPTTFHVESIEHVMSQLPELATPLHPAQQISKDVSEMQQPEPEPEQPEVVIPQTVPELEIPIEDKNSIPSAEVIVQVAHLVLALEPESSNVTGTQIINSSPGTPPSSFGGKIFEAEQAHFESSEKLLDPEPQTEVSSAENENTDEVRESIRVSLGSLATTAGAGVGVMEAEQPAFQSEQYPEHKSHHEVKPNLPGTLNLVDDVSAVPHVVVESTSPVVEVPYKFQAGNSTGITDQALHEAMSRAAVASYSVNEDFTDGAMHVPSRSLPLSPKSPGLKKACELAFHDEELQIKLNSLLREKESWAREKAFLVNKHEQEMSSAMSKIDTRDIDIKALRDETEFLKEALVKEKEDGERKVSELELCKSHLQKEFASLVAAKDALLGDVATSESHLSTAKSEIRRLAMIAAEKEKVISEKELGRSVCEDMISRMHTEKNELTNMLKAAQNEILSLENKFRTQKSDLERQIQDMQRQLDDGRQTPMFFGSARGDRSGGINLEAPPDVSDEMVSISVALTSCLKSSKRNEQKYRTIINELEQEITRLQGLIPSSKVD